MLLLCLTLPIKLSDLGRPTRSIKTPVSIAIRVIEVLNPPLPHHEKVIAHGGPGIKYYWYASLNFIVM